MKILNPKLDLNLFFDSLMKAPKSLLMLDYDGTIAPFKIDPKEAIAYEGVLPRLEKILEGKTRVVFVSGRAKDELKMLLPFKSLPEIIGSYGAEKEKIDSLNEREQMSIDRAASEAKEFAPTLLLERKPVSVALHWRGKYLPDYADQITLVRQAWEKHGLSILNFDQGMELKPIRYNKGTTVQELIAKTEIGTVIAYLGDDSSDEDAFLALGSQGLKVLVRKEIRSTAADLQISPPEELYEFLDNWSKYG